MKEQRCFPDGSLSTSCCAVLVIIIALAVVLFCAAKALVGAQ